ncbi:MAG TPA: SurA N-terminal domain-containing protein [Thermoanaerobaculia bacterium]|nr:SurA N-terminal domain-containing protein [Thermoanaerobaculia bacterium]
MLKLMRDSFQQLKWILVAIVAIFILFIFVDWGAGGARAGASDRGYAARVNGETITYRDFDRGVYYAEENYKRMYGSQLSQEMLDQMGLPRQVLDSLIDQRLLLQEARRLHLSASQEEVRKRILEIPVLNPDGKFIGSELYSRYVTQMGFQSPAEFEDELAREITLQKMESALATSVMVSPKMADAEYRRVSENAKIRYVLYPASREVTSVTVTPADVEAFYKANQTKYSHTEQRDVKYLLADFNRLRLQIIPNDAELLKRYNSSKEDFKAPEAAHVFHILIKVDPSSAPEVDAAARAKAESLVKQLRGGADFATLAKQNSADPSSSAKGGDMGFVDRGTTVPVFDQAAFTIPLNQVSDPIRSQEYGYHIIKVLERRPEAYRTFEQVKPELAAQVADQLAKDQAREEMTRIAARLRQNKPSTPEAFSALASDKVSSNDTQWFQKNDPIPGLGANPALTTWAFGAKQGDVGEMIGTQRGIIIPYLYGIRPAGVTALAEIRDRVTQDAKMAKARELAREALTKAMAGVTSADAVAAKVGLPAADATVNRQGYIAGITGDTSQLVNLALSSAPGQLQGPIIAGDGAIAFQVVQQKKVTDQELKENESAYMDMIRSQQARSLRATLLAKLRKDARVDVNEQVLQSRSKSQPQQGA